MNDLHPALAFLQEKMHTARAVGPDTLRLDVDGAQAEIFVAAANAGPAFFAAGQTRLSYRCISGLPDIARERLRAVLLELKDRLATSRVAGPHDPLPEGGGWTDCARGSDLPAWRDWVTRSYRMSVEAGGRDACTGLPDCLDMRVRPPIQPQWVELTAAPRNGPCSRCGRARSCPAARESDGGEHDLKPLRHADAGSAELAALRVLAEASSVPLADALEAYSLLTTACGDRALDGALPLVNDNRIGCASSAIIRWSQAMRSVVRSIGGDVWRSGSLRRAGSPPARRGSSMRGWLVRPKPSLPLWGCPSASKWIRQGSVSRSTLIRIRATARSAS
jgi:hypothetical protein